MKRIGILSALLAVLALAATTGTARANGDDGGHHCRHDQLNTIIGSGGADVLPGTTCDDVIYGLGGADLIIGNAGNDTLIGGRGDDRLRGVDGYADVIRGGRGFDRCRGDQLDIFIGCERVVRFIVQPVH